MKDNKKSVDDIINMLDSLMDQGKGHINLRVTEDGELDIDSVDVKNQTECDEGDVACKIPTMFYEDNKPLD